jgi:UDPglucose 6-dehydrogenase
VLEAVDTGAANGEPGVNVVSVDRIKKVTSDAAAAVAASDFSLVIVPTPSDRNGRFSNEYVLAACREIGKGLVSNPHHTVVIVSTVMPGSIDSEILRTLEYASGLRAGEDFGLVYSPQFVALGSVIHDFTHPDLILIGKYGHTKAEGVIAMYDRILRSLPQIAVTTPINAELAKLSLNCAVASKIHFSNQLARVVELIPGADVDVITDIIGTDRRIGKAYLRAGIMYGGPCFPRDVEALATLPGATWFCRLAEHNDDSLAALFRTVRATVGVIGILGTSYKVGSNVTERAVGTILCDYLRDACQREVHTDYMQTAEEVIALSDTVIVTLDDMDYRRVPREVWTSKPRVVIDCWRSLQHLDRCHEHLTYIPIGIGPRP